MAGRVTTHVVVDANFSVALVASMPWSTEAKGKLVGWRTAGALIYVPVLWEYEVVSAMRKIVRAALLTEDGANHALETLFQFSFQRVAPDLNLHRAALRWASRLGQVVAYEAQYLALAEQLGAELWTADRRLAAQARELGVAWVRCITD